MIPEKISKMCDNRFATHKATLVQNTDLYLIIDWRRADGSEEYYVNYILDKDRGSLIVSGDLGSSIATWHYAVDPEQLKCWIKNDIGYYISKMQCTTNMYDRDEESIVADIKDHLKGCDALDIFNAYKRCFSNYPDTAEELWEFLEIDVGECLYGDEFVPSKNLTEFCIELDADYYEWLYSCGKRINPRVYLWADGFYKACKQLWI